MKYSILIVSYKDYASLNKCIELIRKREQDDYDIIVWDNTPFNQRLDSYNLDRVKTFRNGEENGFAKGVNLASQVAKGEILVFLNPDTEPTGDWLDRMAKGFDSYDYIGCTSDYIAGIQSYLHYLDDPREFVDTKLIIPVCAMIRAETFKEMGGFDERFFLGCEDLDFSWRMNLAGKRMGICTDVFIHHVGHTGYELTPNKAQIIKDMEFKIREKLKDYYGDSVPSSKELWGCKILATELRPQTLSVAIIFRDDLEGLKTLIPSLKFADEIILVDTDPTRNPDKLGAKYWEGSQYDLIGSNAEVKGYAFPWIDDFAAARNFALSKCTGDWVLWLDSDDILDEENAALINALLKKPGNMTALQAVHFGFEVQNVDRDGNIMDTFSQSRLFPRLPGVKWGGLNGCKGLVHETIWESAQAAGLQYIKTNIAIQHTGYGDPEVLAKKQVRNIRLLERETQNRFTLYNLGLCYMNQGNFDKAFEYLEKALDFKDGEQKQFIDHIRYCIAIVIFKGSLGIDVVQYLSENTKPDAYYMLGNMLIINGDEEKKKLGIDLLFQYIKMCPISDIFGSNWPLLKAEAKKNLEMLGVL
jgi:GT2 family glycosyltransferase/tetratricopeptide (TPR) repeat protein